MSKKDPSTMTDDEKLEALEKAGVISEGDRKPEEETPPSDPVIAERKPEEETPPAADPDDKDESDNPPASPGPEKDGNKDAPDPANESQVPPVATGENRPRPLKYIPLDKYQDDKKSWNAEKETLNAKIAELTRLSASKPTESQTEDFVATFAEKYGMDEDDVRKLIPTSAAVPQELVDELRKAKEEKAELQAKQQLADEEKNFDSQFEAAAPSMARLYPNLTPAKKAAIKEELRAMAFSEEYASRELDYVLWKNQEAFAAIANAPDPEQKAPRRTAEGGRPGNSQSKAISADDFKGRKAFDEFFEMETGAVNKIIMDMDPATYASYVSWASQSETGGGVKVQRDGKTVILK